MTAEMSNAAWKGPVDEVHCVLKSMQRVEWRPVGARASLESSLEYLKSH
jgi:hypothetical protein